MPPKNPQSDAFVRYSQELAAYTRQQLNAALKEAKEKGAPEGPQLTASTKPTIPEGGGVVQSHKD